MAVDIVIVRRGNRPELYSQEDLDQFMEFEEGQPIRARLTGFRRARSLAQLRMYWAICRKVAESSPDQHMTAERVSVSVLVELGHIELIQARNGSVIAVPKSIAIANLAHLEACRLFERAWPLLAEMAGVTEAELLAEAGPDRVPEEGGDPSAW